MMFSIQKKTTTSITSQSPDNLMALSRKFWSGENFGPGDQNSRKIGPPGPLSPENLGPAVE